MTIPTATVTLFHPVMYGVVDRSNSIVSFVYLLCKFSLDYGVTLNLMDFVTCYCRKPPLLSTFCSNTQRLLGARSFRT